MDRENLILHLFEINAIKFGNFTLKSGLTSPLYIDLRVVISEPKLMIEVSELLWSAVEDVSGSLDSVCGVPYTALPLATLISAKNELPMLMRRKEVKTYGTKKAIEGLFEPGNVCLVVEDVVTSGSSVLETVEALQAEGVVVHDAVVLLDREQGGRERLQHLGIKLHSVLLLSDVLTTLLNANMIDQEAFNLVKKFVEQNKFELESIQPAIHSLPATDNVILRYSERANVAKHPMAKRLLNIMESKNTNLALAADVNQSKELLQLADKIGPFICMLKTHVDVIKDFTHNTAEMLQELSRKHQFLIFEDRKFADIGETVREQYQGGVYGISSWSDIVTVHPLPGPGIISGLKQVNPDKACVIVAEMSTQGNLISTDYTKSSVLLAEQNRDFVIGFVCQSQLSCDPGFVHLTPGIHMDVSGDNLGQQYRSPRDAIVRRRCDVIIVGRAIREAVDPVSSARMYRDAGWSAYNELFQ